VLTASNGTSYLWSTGATTKSITVTTAGNYVVTVYNGSTPSVSAPLPITVSALPTATITAGGPTTFCTGGSVNLTATSNTSYVWSNGQTSQTINVTTGGNY